MHGDYDVDGVTSTVILRRLLELLGADVVHFIPDRIKDGYGLEPAGIERLAAQQVSVVVSVDCGIRSGAAAIRARELGLDLVVTDHHEPDATLPPALAVINPKRPDCPYPDKDLAGVGVALKLVQALCQRTDHTRWLPGFIKMAALGTVADVVPLRGENRVIAKLGLDQLSRGPHTTGLRALLDSTGLLGQTLTSFHVAFRLAPRINAAGRMSTPDLATRLLLLADEGRAPEAKDLAEQLETENLKRQQEEADILAAARSRVDTDPDVGAHAMLVVWGEGWHRGVIGIVASKLVDAFHRPTIVLAIDGDLAYGSGRSIPGFDLLGALGTLRRSVHPVRWASLRRRCNARNRTTQRAPEPDHGVRRRPARPGRSDTPVTGRLPSAPGGDHAGRGGGTAGDGAVRRRKPASGVPYRSGRAGTGPAHHGNPSICRWPCVKTRGCFGRWPGGWPSEQNL